MQEKFKPFLFGNHFQSGHHGCQGRHCRQNTQTTIRENQTFLLFTELYQLNLRTSSPLSASLIFSRHFVSGSHTLPSPFVFSYNEKYSSAAFSSTTEKLRNVEKPRGMTFSDKYTTPSVACSDFPTNKYHYAPYSCSERTQIKSSFWSRTSCQHSILAIHNTLKLHIWNGFGRLCAHIMANV